MQPTSIKKREVSGADASPWREVVEEAVTGGSGRREERTLELCEAMIDIAAALFNVSGRDLRKPGRSCLGVSRVRQVAMYVAHVILRLNMADIGKAFGRDRTTVLHACQLIEDLRDDEEFDRIITMTERVALAAFGCRARA
ncbi:helix-turn-helix domain-containing protein [Mesorhizobium marinum]|uniref:Helix-turn-helix domain-containing protein n=1 Tax=Mesorhizobium marinum TaxID=3228790 RepID=A0ABV3R0H5_9HYPH